MKVNEICENISHTSKRLRDIERSKGVKPGTPEWFKLWFSLPYLKESLLHEGYKIQLERGKDMDVLHIVDTKTNKRTEVRGKSGYETAYDPECPLHQLLDKIGKAANISELMNGEVVTINPKHPDSERANAETDRAFNEDVSVPENVFHMKNRLLKVKQITDAMRNRPLMFRSFVHDGEPIARIIKKVTNDSARSIKTGSNEKQNEVLEKLGISHPTFAAMANSKYANVRRDSLEDMEVWGMQNIFIPMSNEIYYSDAIEDLGMGRKSIGRNIAVQSDFDVDEAVATYKKGWPPANFNNEIIVDTKEYYLLNLRSFLLELTSPEIKDRIKRLKSMYDKSYEKRAEENHINDIMKDIFKTKITTYSDISNWISNVAVPFVDMLAANRGEPTNNDDYDDDDDDWFDYNIDIDDYDNDDELKLESDSSKANTATSTAFNEDAEVDLHGNAERGYVLSKISVSADQRGQGRGTEIMQQIVDRMDKEGAIIALTPDTVFGGAKGKLIDFYKRFGFVPNKGRNKDFRFRETMIRYPKQINEENIYDILEPEDCGPFDGGCVLVAQALQQIHGGDIVVLVNDKGIADHAAVKVGNTLIDYDGPLPADKFVKRFEKNELVNITGIRSMKPNDLPGATRNQSLVPKIVNLLSKKKKYRKVNEETGKEMLKIFRGMHHDAGMNKDMDAFIRSHDWELRDFTPDMFPSEEEFFDYDDPFDRIIDIDYSHRVDLSQPIIVGPQYSDGKYSVIDGNHRAARAQSMGKTIKGYFPVKKVTEAFDTDVKWVLDMDARNKQIFATKIDDAYIELTYKRIFPADVYIEFTRGGRMSVTGEGSQNKIFGAVINHVKQWVAKNKPPRIIFSAFKPNTGAFGSKDTTRSGLYSKMVQRFASQNGYDYSVEDTGSEDTFILTKKQQPAQTNESLDQPYPYKWGVQSEDEWVARAKTDSGAILDIRFEYWDGEWDIEFLLDGGYKATATGDQFRIFATVVSAIKEWWKSTSAKGIPVSIIRFSADKLNNQTGKTGSREKLYRRFAQQFANSIGFTVQRRDKISATDFELVNTNYNEHKVNEAEGLGLTIFDIDETLMRTTAQIKVVKDGNTVRSLTNQEFNNYKLQPGEEFDFGEFRNAEKFARESEPIGPMIAKLKAILRNAGDSKVIMLTARSDFDDKETFLDTFRKLGIDMSRVHVHRAGNLPGNPAENKEVFIRQYLDTGKYSRIRLYDDSMGNIRMFNALAKEYPDVQFYPYLVNHDGSIKTVRENDSNKVVTELLNTQAKDAKWTMSGEDMSRMEFTASNGIVYEIDFLAPYIGPDEIYPTDFVSDMPKDQIERAVFIEFSQKGATGQAKQGVAGTGAAAEVFGIVTNAILEFARKRKPSMLYFQAAEPNRQKLYAAIVNRLVKSMPGYTVKRIGGKFAVYSNNIGENFADGKVKYAKPQFDVEWEEAERYPEFVKIGKAAWIELAKKGKAVTIKSAKGINNTDAADPDSFKSLDSVKQSRALDQLKSGTVEMPIVAVYSDGWKELIGGNTRLTAMLAQNGQATVWAFKVPDEVAELAENFLGKIKGALGFGWEKIGDTVRGSVVLNYIDAQNFDASQDLKKKIKSSTFKLINLDIETAKKYRDYTDKKVAFGGSMIDPDKEMHSRQWKLTHDSLVKNPPVLMNDGDILDGNHRLDRAIKLELPKIPVLMQVGKSVEENFADGKKPGRKGLAKRMGVNTKASVSSLRKTAKNSTGEKQRMAHWLANMKAGKAKKK